MTLHFVDCKVFGKNWLQKIVSGTAAAILGDSFFLNLIVHEQICTMYEI